MAFFDNSALNPGVAKREVFGWAMYDFANSGYTTVVLTAVFNVYFIGVVAQGAAWGTLAWTLALSASNVLVLALMPAIGAWADAHAAKRRLLIMATIGCVATTAALAMAGRGDLALAVGAIILSNFFYSVGESITAAFCQNWRAMRRWARCLAGAGALATSAACCHWACAWPTC